MNEQQARLVLLVKAVESAQPSDAVLSTAQRDAAGAQAQADNGRLPSDAQRAAWTESFMVRRAQALWPLALMYPPSVPFGLGQVAERSLVAVAGWMAATPWADAVPSTTLISRRFPLGKSRCALATRQYPAASV